MAEITAEDELAVVEAELSEVCAAWHVADFC